MQGDVAAQLVDVTAASLLLLEAEGILHVIVEECSQQVERVKVVLLQCEWHRDVAALVQVLDCKDAGACVILNHVARVGIDEVAVLVDWATLFVIRALAAGFLVDGHDHISFVVAIESAEYVDLIEVSPFVLNASNKGIFETTGLVGRLQHAHVHLAWGWCIRSTRLS